MSSYPTLQSDNLAEAMRQVVRMMENTAAKDGSRSVVNQIIADNVPTDEEVTAAFVESAERTAKVCVAGLKVMVALKGMDDALAQWREGKQ